MRSASIREWLAAEGLSQYVDLFEHNRIGMDVLPDLTDHDLLDLGIPLGDRKRLLKAIRFSAQSASAQDASAPVQTASATQAERRQLTVLFCDLVGSTALAERLDPEDLRDLMQVYQRACCEVITRYEGHVAQYLGDGLMVYFGWPKAHEDDAVRAIRAGLELTQVVSSLGASPPVTARVGVHTGLVVVGETGDGDASVPKAAVGDTPNIAARLQALAEPGTVVVSERTSSLARGLFDYTDLGVHSLKGVSEPIRLLRVSATRAVESRFEAARSEMTLTPLVGREEELALLLRRWQQAKEGEGQVVVVGGEPGIGKSRLTRVVRERIGHEPHLVLRYQCSPYHLNSTLYPVIDQFERAAGFTRDDTPEQKLDKMQAMLAGTDQQVEEAAPLFATLLSLPTDRYPSLNLSPQQQKERTLEMLAAQVEALARKQALLLIYEDVHWLDATSQEALDLLVPRLRDLPVLVIISYRPEYLPRWSDQAHVTLLTLNRLGRRQAAELVTRLTGGKSLPSEVLDQILAHTDGVPLFVEELTKSVVESKLLRDAGDRYLLTTPLPALAIPTTLRDSLIARLDRLAPVREIAQVGACIGREFSYRLLAALSPVQGAHLDEALTQLNATGLLFRRGAPPDATYTFKHALVQDAAYDSLLRSRRMQLHVQIAEILERDSADRITTEPELVAHHFTQAGVHERAVPYWMRAGERALARAAFQEATGHLRAALSGNASLAPSSERDRRELDIRLMLAAAYLSSLGWAAVQVAEVLTPARQLADKLNEHDKLAAILYYLWFHHLMLCEYQDTAAIVDELQHLAQARNDSATSVIAAMAEALTHWFTGHPRKAREAADRMVQTYDENLHGHLAQICMHDPKCLTLIWAGQWLWALGYPDQAHRAAQEQLALARRLGHPFNLFASLSVGTVGLTFLGETRLARQWLADAHDLARQLAMTFFAEAIVPFWDGCALIAQGDYAEGYVTQTKGCKGWRDTGPLHLIPLAHIMRASALINLHRSDEAQSLLEEALRIIERTGQRSDEAEAFRVLGEMHEQKPQPDMNAAEKCFQNALQVARTQEAKGLELRAATALARLWHRQGKAKEARDLLTSIYGWFAEGFETRDLQAAKRLINELA